MSCREGKAVVSLRMFRSFLSLSLVLILSGSLFAADWPQWLGSERDGVWRDTGIVSSFSEEGPEISWRVPVAHGYSSPAVANGKVYLSDYEISEGKIANNPSARSPLQGAERIHCFDAATGDLLWQHKHERTYTISYAGGPRATPTIADDKVYHLGAEGDLICLNAETGEVVWQKDLKSDYKIESPIWGFSAHPLVVGDTLYCVVGGAGSVAVAFDKDTGEEKWRALSAVDPGYSPPTMIEHAGMKQLLIWHPESLNALDPEDGSVYWSFPLKAGYGMSIMAPRKSGDKIFASAIGRVGVLLQLAVDGKSVSQVWRAKPKEAMFCANSTPVIRDGMIYGCDIDTSLFIGARLSDGERIWQTSQPIFGDKAPARGTRHGTAFLTEHKESGLFYLYTETGDLVIAELSPEGYSEKARANILEPTNEAFGRPVVWAAPAFAMKAAFLRNDKELVRVNLAAE